MFSEERGALAGRMREVQVTFAEAPAALPAPCPQSWLNPQLSGAVLRYVETAFGGDRSVNGLAGVRHVEYRALKLRGKRAERTDTDQILHILKKDIQRMRWEIAASGAISILLAWLNGDIRLVRPIGPQEQALAGLRNLFQALSVAA